MRKEILHTVQHHGDPVAHDIKHQGDHEALLEKRNTAMRQGPWALDGKESPLPDYQHGDPPDYGQDVAMDYQKKKGETL